jgi:ATP-dependent RNA helicase DDX24/MAK5
MAIIGGMSSVKQQRQLNSKPEIIVATPGRLWEMIETDQVNITVNKRVNERVNE